MSLVRKIDGIEVHLGMNRSRERSDGYKGGMGREGRGKKSQGKQKADQRVKMRKARERVGDSEGLVLRKKRLSK